MFERSFVFIRHEVEGMGVFHVHRDGVGLTGFVAVLTLTDAVGIADEERLLYPSTSRLVQIEHVGYKGCPLLFACVASHFDFSSFV